ncbi:MAG: hypothetical protein RMJ66_08515, partial [Bacteroidia bacterium]|nr:hypothetical protein [Bacteroidia bacterium]
QAITSPPLPAAYPPNVISALYTLSDHLPVVARFALRVTPYITSLEGESYHLPSVIYTTEGRTLHLKSNHPMLVRIIDTIGREWYQETLSPGTYQSYDLPTGFYILQVLRGSLITSHLIAIP